MIVSADTDNDFDITVGALDAPSDFALTLLPASNVQINWIKNSAADTTMIRRKPDSYPSNLGDGDEVYNSTGLSYIDGGVTSGNTYYYRAWSYNATYNIFSTTYVQDYIYVETPALFDIKNIFILDSVIPALHVVCAVENVGDPGADITVTWVLIRVDTGAIFDTGSDTFAVAGHSEEIYHILPSATYVGLCQITFNGEGATASQLFITEETLAPPDGGGGGGGGGGAVPSARDSDGDGLTDAEEEFYGTDPNKADTDGDGYSDYTEINSGTDPLNPSSHPAGISSIYFVVIIVIIAVVFILIIFLFAKRERDKNKKNR